MKRIIISLIMIIYVSTFIFSIYTEKNESYECITLNEKKHIQVENWDNSNSIKEKINEIKQYAIDKKINILKIDRVDEKKQVFYCAIGNPEEFCDKLNIKVAEFVQVKNNNEEWIISNRKQKKDYNDCIELDTFYNDREIKYIDMLKMESSIVGEYIVDGNIEEFAENMGFKYSEDVGANMSNTDTIIKILIVLVVFIFILSYVYYIVQMQKKIAISKMLGWNENDIFIKVFLKDNILINTSCIVISLIVASIFTFIYNGGKEITDVIRNIFIKDIKVMIVILIISTWLAYMLRDKDIYKIFKNKRPTKELNILNLGIKIVLIFGISICMLIQQPNIKQLSRMNRVVDKLEEAHNYACIQINSLYGMTSDTEVIVGIAPKLNQLYKEEEKKGAMLSCWMGIDDEDYLFINNNYVKNNKIYDINGNLVQGNEDSTITVLIPDKYSDKKEYIVDSISRWIESQKNVDKYLEEEYSYYKGQDLSNVKIEYEIIKDNQEYVTFNIDRNIASERIMCIVNGDNLSYDTYLTFFSVESVYREVDQQDDLYGQFKDGIDKCNLEEEVTGIQFMKDKFSMIVTDMKEFINIVTVILSVLIIFIILIFYFIAENYLENIKKTNAIKYIHGYNFMDRHKEYLQKIIIQYVIIFIIFWLAKSFIISVVNGNSVSYGVSIVCICLSIMALDVLLSTVFLTMLEKKNIKDILKGA